MKNICILFALVFVSSAAAYTGFGVCNYGKETLPTVICYGPTVLKGTTVTGNVKVAGPLHANSVKVNGMSIAGSLKIQQSTVAGVVDVTGSLDADTVSFAQNITVAADEMTLNHSTVKGSVTISSLRNKPYLKVQCGSIVAGNVTFIGSAGVIQVTDDSTVQGKIVNGNLEFVKTKCK